MCTGSRSGAEHSEAEGDFPIGGGTIDQQPLSDAVPGHFLQLQPQNRRYGPTKAKALACEWEDGAVEVHYRGECMDYEDLVVRPQVVQAGPSKPGRETAKSIKSKPAQDHPWRQGYEQRMTLQQLSRSQVSALVGVSASATP